MLVQCASPSLSLSVKGGTPKHLVSKVAPRKYSTSSADVAHSTLGSNVKVISVDIPSPVSTLSMYVKAGSRYETSSTFGSTHFLKHLAFKGTPSKSAIRLIRDLEVIGASYHTDISREAIGYHLQNLNLKKDENLNLLAHTLRCLIQPNLHEYEIDNVRNIIERESSGISHCPQTSMIEALHAEAFPDYGLGNRLFVSPFSLEAVDTFSLANYVKATFFCGERISIVGTGFDHETLVKKLEPHFSSIPKFLPIPGLPNQDKTSYVGGRVSRISGPSGVTHVAVAFQGFPVSHKDQLALAVLKEILESNSQFSTNSWILGSNVFNFSYSDAGLFGIFATAQAGHGEELVKNIIKEITVLNNLKNDVVETAKASVKVKVLKCLSEDRFNLANHIYSGVTNGVDRSLSVDSVSAADLTRVAQALSSQKPVIVAAGDVRGIK